MRNLADFLTACYAWLCSALVLIATGVLLAFLIHRGAGSFGPQLFFGETPWLAAVSGTQPVFDGIWPAMVGTIYLVLLSALMALPVGVASGIFLAEYASPRLRSVMSSPVDVLAGAPSIVMGLFGFALILFLRRSFLPEARPCLLLAALCIALLVLPYLIRTTQTALQAIPEHLRMLGPSLGLNRWQTVRHLLLPLAGRGVLSGVILAIGRAAEDTAVILLTGVVARSGLPASLWDRFEAVPFRIYYLAAEHQSPDELNQGFGMALVLLTMTGSLFVTASLLHRSLQHRWKTS